jgi:hypothetical protein
MDDHPSFARGWTEPRLQAGSPSIPISEAVLSASCAFSWSRAEGRSEFALDVSGHFQEQPIVQALS